MLFLLLCVASAQPFYQASLRHLPAKYREQRILMKVQQEVYNIQNRIIEEASANHTFLNFTLFCLDPNHHYRETVKRNTFMGETFHEPIYSFPVSYITGQYPYQKEGPRYRLSTYDEKMIKTELIDPRPYCNAKYGYELYQMIHTKLEDTPQAYATIFFKKLNIIFPDIQLAVSNKRNSDGLYDSDCCPLFTVSW